MLHRRIADFGMLVWTTAARVGLNAAKVSDVLLGENFPGTNAEAIIEGADKFLRDGLLADVRRVLKSPPPDDAQLDFGSVDPSFLPFTADLRSATYFVESLDVRVPIPLLINDPALLNDARQYMRRKGEECIAEANRLDRLYDAVTAA